MEKVQYQEDYIGNKKVSDIDWRKYKTAEDDQDEDVDKPASKELVSMLGVDPDELFNDK
jgi:predicted transcriptional regulator